MGARNPATKQQNGQKAEDAIQSNEVNSEVDGTANSNRKTKDSVESSNSSSVPSKRKATIKEEPSKAPRRSARGAQQPSIDPARILRFLISPASTDFCRPKDEIEDLKTRGSDIKTYSSSKFTPFEELICAVILSRPISHALGLRSIRTIFNDPYNFTTPKALRDAGPEGRRKALDEARTQHRQKTAEELGYLTEALAEKLGNDEDDLGMEKVKKEGDHDPEKALEMIKSSVKGVGKTAIEIFRRRIQGVWPAFYPFVDQKTSVSLEQFGLPSDAKDLEHLVEKDWEELIVENIEADNEQEKKRKAFVRLLEHAVGAHLEGKVDEVKAQAAQDQ